MTASISLREYFASAGSAFTKADAEVIGPQLEVLAEDGDVSERNVVDIARSENSPLHRFFDWNNESAADKFRLHQAGTMMRSIRVRYAENDKPRVTPAYKIGRAQPKSTFSQGHNVLHGDSAAAVQKAKAAFDELTSWRARYQPFVVVWKDFAHAFRGVANQISEAQDFLQTEVLDDRTDTALTEMVEILGSLRSWQERNGGIGSTWAALSEQAGFVIEAIDSATAVFSREQMVMERNCLRCSKPFRSGGPGNRMCERCAGKT